MAKQSDPFAGLKPEKTGGPVSGLFAEENEFDRRALWRIGSWGAAAVGAVTLAVMSNQWSLSLRRDQVAAVDVARQAQQIQSLAKESQNETRRLASAIETLNNDRDRLFSRVTVIEQGLDSVTGALAKQTTPAAASPQAATSGAGTPQALQQNATAAPAPVLAPVATTAVAAPSPDKPHADPSRSAASRASAAANTEAAANAGPATAATTSPSPISSAAGASLMAKSMMAPPDPSALKLIEAAKPADTRLSDDQPADIKAPDMKMAEANVNAKADANGPDAAPAVSPDVVASASATDEPQMQAADVAVKRTDFAVELGSANSLAGLRSIWRGVRRLNGELGALNPIIVIRENHTGFGMQLHLAAGPLKDAAAAAKICAVLAETKRTCETTVYDGQRLAMKADEGQSPPTIRAASEAKSEARLETKPDARLDAREGKAEGKAEAKAEGKVEAKTDAKPGSSKRWYRHAKKEEPAPPPPPAPEPAPPPPPAPTSTFSSLFGHRN